MKGSSLNHIDLRGGELAGEGVEEFAERGADRIDHSHKRVRVAVAARSGPDHDQAGQQRSQH